MGTTIEILENTVRSWVEDISGRHTYILEDLGPLPVDENNEPAPYATIHMMPIDHLPHDVKSYETLNVGQLDEKQVETIRGLVKVTFALSFWGGTTTEVMTIANRVRASVMSANRFKDILVISGRSHVSDIIQLPEEFEGNRRQRSEFNLGLYTTFDESFDVEYYETVSVTADGSEFILGADSPPLSKDQSNCP